VPPQAVAERMARLRTLIAARNRRFRQNFLGRELSAITLRTAQGQTTPALTDNFLEVLLNAEVPANQSVRVVVTGLTETGLTGQLAS
jgi:tRNA A37 methylthiotransferase MiaB